MSQISVVLADEQPIRRLKLAKALQDHESLQLFGQARGLTEAFALTEDHVPEVVVLPQSMVERPEFEMMDGLLRALRTKVVCLAKPEVSVPADYRVLCPEIDGDRLCKELSCLSTSVRNFKERARPETPDQASTFKDRAVILIGASTGGIEALIDVLSVFPDHCPPTLIVQHTSGRFTPSLVRLLQRHSKADIREARHGETLTPGQVRLAPGNEKHLEIAKSAPLRLALTPAPPVSGHLPSVDTLFHSARRQAKDVVGVLLTGMGRDGAVGLKAIKDAGGHTIAQDEETSLIYGMPRAAVELGGAVQQLPITKIGAAALTACLREPALDQTRGNR